MKRDLRDALAAKEAAETRYKDISTGKFIESGVTGGIALMLQSDASFSGGEWVRQRTSELTALPYLLVLPGYWGNKPETDKYCAGRFNSGAVESQAAADGLALQRADVLLVALLSAVEANMNLDEARALLLSSVGNSRQRAREVSRLSETTFKLATSFSALPPKSNEDQRTRHRELLRRAIASELLGWTTGVPPETKYCVARKFGIFLGFPVNSFTARIQSTAFGITSNQERSVRPVISFGLGIVPNAIVTGLVGFSYSIVQLPGDMGDANDMRGVGYWTLTAGIGGNLDIINLFRRK